MPSAELTVTCSLAPAGTAASTGPGYFYLNVTNINFNTYPPDATTYVEATNAMLEAAGATPQYIFPVSGGYSASNNIFYTQPTGDSVFISVALINKSYGESLAETITAAQVSGALHAMLQALCSSHACMHHGLLTIR